jgi:hypothetical protein
MSLLRLSCQGTSALMDTSLHTVRQTDRPTIHANLKRAAKNIVVRDKGSTSHDDLFVAVRMSLQFWHQCIWKIEIFCTWLLFEMASWVRRMFSCFPECMASSDYFPISTLWHWTPICINDLWKHLLWLLIVSIRCWLAADYIGPYHLPVCYPSSDVVELILI